MGYLTELEFVDVLIDKERVPQFRKYCERHRDDENRRFHYMLRYLFLSIEDGYLNWNLSAADKRHLQRYSGEKPLAIDSVDFDEVSSVWVEFGANDGDRVGKWYESKALVKWLTFYCIGGRIIEISREGDGLVWGWEFASRSGDRTRSPRTAFHRKLGLLPAGPWEPRKRR
jgi:hypothetical protein